jgi:hypothetical protein
MVNTAADDVDTMVDDQPIVLSEQGQNVGKHTPRPQPLASAPRLHTQQPCPPPRTLETDPLSWLEDLGLVTRQTPRPVVLNLREADDAENSSAVHDNQPLFGDSAGSDSLLVISSPKVPIPDVALPEARPHGSVGEK